MRKNKFRQKSWLFLLILIFFSCKNEMDEYYDNTTNASEGSAWEILEEKGNYSIFLEAAELANFKPILQGKGLVTVMAPNDSAFNVYLEEEGLSSIEDMDEDELTMLIGYHLIYYSYDKDMLINFRPTGGDGESDESKATNAGLYYKYRTRSQEAASSATDTDGVAITVYHNEKLLPVFSYEFFDTKGIDASTNYSYFYPNSEWTGDDGFNVSNASVTDYELVTDNGYIYLIDQVLSPLNTIYDELSSRSDYSEYLDLYDRFSYYSLDDDLTTDFGDGTDLYLKEFDGLPNIDNEWTVSDYRDVASMAYGAYNVFAPSNDALDDYFDSYWAQGGYASLDSVDDLVITYLLENTVYSSTVVFPEEIENGDVTNSFDMEINFDTDNVPTDNRVMCSNGALYALDEINPPAMFESVTGPAFKYKKYSYYLKMLDASSMLVSLSSDDGSFIELIPDNDQMTESGVSVVSGDLYTTEDGELSSLSTSTMTDIVNMHTVSGSEEISTSGAQVLRTNLSYNYWFILNGQITSSRLYNSEMTSPSSTVDFYDLHELTNNGEGWSNGKAYSYDCDEMFNDLEGETSVQNYLAITRDETYPFYEFSNLLRNAGLVDSSEGTLTFLDGLRCVIFIPTNEAIETAVSDGDIPGVSTSGAVEDTTSLANYLEGYFLPTAANGITTYPYLGSGVSGTYFTMGTYENSEGEDDNTEVIIYDDGSSLSIQKANNETSEGEGDIIDVVSTYHYFPFSFDDGGVQFINGVL